MPLSDDDAKRLYLQAERMKLELRIMALECHLAGCSHIHNEIARVDAPLCQVTQAFINHIYNHKT